MTAEYSIMNNLIKNGEPKKFYSHPHAVQNRLLSFTTEDQYYNDFRKQLIDKFNNCEIKAHLDNKIVFCLTFHNTQIYVGFYDWTISVGFSVRSFE